MNCDGASEHLLRHTVRKTYLHGTYSIHYTLQSLFYDDTSRTTPHDSSPPSRDLPCTQSHETKPPQVTPISCHRAHPQRPTMDSVSRRRHVDASCEHMWCWIEQSKMHTHMLYVCIGKNTTSISNFLFLCKQPSIRARTNEHNFVPPVQPLSPTNLPKTLQRST